MPPQNELDHIKAHIELLPTKDLADLRDWLSAVLIDRWCAQHGANPALLRALKVFKGNRQQAYAFMVGPSHQLGGATPIAVAQSPTGVQQVLEVIDQLVGGVRA